MNNKNITINVELESEEAEAFAQFLKRVSFDDFRKNAYNDNEAYLMQDVGEKIRKALADEGFSPR